MTAQQLEQVLAAAYEDLRRLLKEYARVGYEAAHGQGDDNFEILWRQVFDADCAEEKPGE